MSEIRLVNTASNTYFINNKIEIKDSIPTEGVYNVGDIVIKATQIEHTAIGWICIEAGNPGVWSEFGGMFEQEDEPIVLDPESVGMNELSNEVKSKINSFDSNKLVIKQMNEQINNIQEQTNNIQDQIENGVGDVSSETIGDLNELNTTTKDSIVNAINELYGKITDQIDTTINLVNNIIDKL